mmetsp:Transcript_22122/g.37404  ORF Transcript_22122/g.37404 Transcript_22122/m.37404 type:complete len:229 (+) Transcript_22122:720-1406(+)
MFSFTHVEDTEPPLTSTTTTPSADPRAATICCSKASWFPGRPMSVRSRASFSMVPSMPKVTTATSASAATATASLNESESTRSWHLASPHPNATLTDANGHAGSSSPAAAAAAARAAGAFDPFFLVFLATVSLSSSSSSRTVSSSCPPLPSSSLTPPPLVNPSRPRWKLMRYGGEKSSFSPIKKAVALAKGPTTATDVLSGLARGSRPTLLLSSTMDCLAASRANSRF